jgi:hypothetical protein
MVEALNGENGYRYVDIFPQTVRFLGRAYSIDHLSPPPRISPQSFEEIYMAREELASFTRSIGRTEAEQNNYRAYIQTLGNPETFIINKYFDGVGLGENDKRFVIVPDEFPATLPNDASHRMMWYLDEKRDHGWVADKITAYILSLGLTSRDFVIYRKPPNGNLYLSGFSRSIDIPHVHIIVRKDSADTAYGMLVEG